MIGGKVWKDMLAMKLKLGVWVCGEKRDSEETPFPPRDDSTWQSPYILAAPSTLFNQFQPTKKKKKKKETVSDVFSFCLGLVHNFDPNNVDIQRKPRKKNKKTQKERRKGKAK